MNEKLLRLVLWLVCLASVGGFGWRIYDYMIHRDERMAPVDLAAIEDSFGSAPVRNTSHLDDFEEYRVIQELNVSGYVEPEVAELPEAPAAPDPIEAGDVSVPYIQLEGGDGRAVAWIQPAKAKASAQHIPGDFRAVGDRFELEGKEGVELEVVSISVGEVVLAVVESGQEISVRPGTMEVEQSQIVRGDPSAGEDEAAQRYEPPPTTRLNESGEFEVGTRDVKAIREMSEEQIVASVPLRRARDPRSNEVIGLRVREVRAGTVFARQGLEKDDIILEVNGEPARSRDDLFQRMRDFEGDVLEVRIQRRGGVRTLRYRLPR